MFTLLQALCRRHSFPWVRRKLKEGAHEARTHATQSSIRPYCWWEADGEQEVVAAKDLPSRPDQATGPGVLRGCSAPNHKLNTR
jgi:hypothetical protein